jgi:hypothetical protein
MSRRRCAFNSFHPNISTNSFTHLTFIIASSLESQVDSCIRGVLRIIDHSLKSVIGDALPWGVNFVGMQTRFRAQLLLRTVTLRHGTQLPWWPGDFNHHGQVKVRFPSNNFIFARSIHSLPLRLQSGGGFVREWRMGGQLLIKRLQVLVDSTNSTIAQSIPE